MKESRDITFGRLLATIEVAMKEADRTIDTRRYMLSPASTYAKMFEWTMKDNTMRGIIEKYCLEIVSNMPKDEFNDTSLKATYIDGYLHQKIELDKIFKIRRLRKETGMTQETFGTFCGNIPKRTIQNWENGVSLPPDYVINLIEDKLKRNK